MQDNSAYYAFVMWRCSEVVTTRLTRNQLYRKVPWVRIPPSPPKRLFPLAERLVGFLLCGFTLLSTVACETQNHPLCGCALIVIQKMSHSFYNSKCSGHYCKERNDSLWLIKQMNCLIQNGCASTISYSPQSIDEKLYLINIVKV